MIDGSKDTIRSKIISYKSIGWVYFFVVTSLLCDDLAWLRIR